MADVQINQLPVASTIDQLNDLLPIWTNSISETQAITRNTYLGIIGSPLGNTDTQTVSNKTFGNSNAYTAKDGSLTLQNTSDITKQANFSLANVTAGTTRTYTLPNASVTLASLSGTETLSNKTLTAPAISGGTIDNSTITVDSISGHTSATIVSVGGVQMNNGTIGTTGAVTTASIAAGAVVPNSLVASSGAGWAWTSYAPTFTGSGSNPAIGNGTLVGSYTQIGKTVFAYVRVAYGSTTSNGSGAILLGLPVAARTSNRDNTLTPIGHATMLDSGTHQYVGNVLYYDANTVEMRHFTVTSTNIVTDGDTTFTAPFTPGTADTYEAYFYYEAA